MKYVISFYKKKHKVVVIDDFLESRVLDEIYAFCLESTIWFGDGYKNDRIGAFQSSGFRSPLINQISKEIRMSFDKILSPWSDVEKIWAFKSGERLGASDTNHADGAFINLNLWITPDKANLDAGRGGLIVHDLKAPKDWSFDQYNSSPDLIREYIERYSKDCVKIPYKCNRAILFESDYFHSSDEIRFVNSYESRRINITFLYGDRAAAP